MPKGQFPVAYLHQPVIDKPIEAIYQDIDAFSHETFADEPALFPYIDFFVPLPPLAYEGKFIKGICVTQAADLLIQRFPQMTDWFNVVGYSMWSSYPWARNANAYLTSYVNPERETWFRDFYAEDDPVRANMPLIPMASADFTHEYYLGPVPTVTKDIDVLVVSRLSPLKNIPMILEALQCIERKQVKPLNMTLVVGKTFDAELNGLNEQEVQLFHQIRKIIKQSRINLDVIPKVSHFRDLPALYSRSKALVLGSLIEGKNRTLFEAASCNTPVVCFKQFNQYARGSYAPAFPDGAGVMAEQFTPESLADAIQQVLHHPRAFRPREAFLSVSGRKHFFDMVIRAFPEYAQLIPGYDEQSPHRTLWLDLAVYNNYRLSMNEFLYGKRWNLSRPQGLEAIADTLKQYGDMLGLSMPVAV